MEMFGCISLPHPKSDLPKNLPFLPLDEANEACVEPKPLTDIRGTMSFLHSPSVLLFVISSPSLFSPVRLFPSVSLPPHFFLSSNALAVAAEGSSSFCSVSYNKWTCMVCVCTVGVCVCPV